MILFIKKVELSASLRSEAGQQVIFSRNAKLLALKSHWPGLN